jgi:hypothetical protein
MEPQYGTLTIEKLEKIKRRGARFINQEDVRYAIMSVLHLRSSDIWSPKYGFESTCSNMCPPS